MGVRFGAAPEPKPHAILLNGFSLHNGVHLHASDREGLAHLCGYGARPPLAQRRLETLPNGVLLLGFKRPLDNGRKAIALTPSELIARLAAIVPPPRAHLVRFHGVFGPASKWRAEVVPKPAVPKSHCERAAPAPAPEGKEEKPQRRPSAQVPWAELLLRVFKEDVLQCPCGGRRRAIAFVKEKKAIEAILQHLNLPTTGPPLSPARVGEEPIAARGWDRWQPPIELPPLPARVEPAFIDSPWQDDVPALQR
jgi:Putative transposase